MVPHSENANIVDNGSDTAKSASKQYASKVPAFQFPKPPVFSDPQEEQTYLKGRLAAAFRIFGKNGYDEGVAGHISHKDPIDPHTFWVNPFGVAFSQIRSSDLIRVSESGEILEGGETRLLNTAAFMIHSGIHKARPDVVAACHTHSIYGRAFCSLGRTLDCITQDSCAFYDVGCSNSCDKTASRMLTLMYQDHVLYDSFNGVVLAEEEGKNIAAALGQKKAALLQNHGLLTVGGTIEAAVFWFVSLEKCCQAQLMADAAAAGRGGETVKIGDEEARFTYKSIGTPLAGWFSAKPMFDVIAAETKGEHLK